MKEVRTGYSPNLQLDNPPASDGDIAQATEQLLQTGRSQSYNHWVSRQKQPRQVLKRRTCWQGPGLWVHIVAAVQAIGMTYASKHPTAVVKRLQITHRDTGLFDKLHESTVGRWFSTDPDGQVCWWPTVLIRVMKASGQEGRGRSKKLVSQRELVLNCQLTRRQAEHPKVLDGAV